MGVLGKAATGFEGGAKGAWAACFRGRPDSSSLEQGVWVWEGRRRGMCKGPEGNRTNKEKRYVLRRV